MQQFVDACHGQPGIATGAEALRCVEILERAYLRCEQYVPNRYEKSHSLFWRFEHLGLQPRKRDAVT
jgi:hypothetical protein